jgi:hypothetical protein
MVTSSMIFLPIKYLYYFVTTNCRRTSKTCGREKKSANTMRVLSDGYANAVNGTAASCGFNRIPRSSRGGGYLVCYSSRFIASSRRPEAHITLVTSPGSSKSMASTE